MPKSSESFSVNKGKGRELPMQAIQ